MLVLPRVQALVNSNGGGVLYEWGYQSKEEDDMARILPFMAA